MTSLIETETLLVVDIGRLMTRAEMFDVVEEHYRFIGMGESLSTVGFPYHNAGEGVRIAIEKLQDITGRTLLEKDGELISPRDEGGFGVDRFFTTISAGNPVKVVCVGLLDDVSLKSATRLVRSALCEVVDTISINDQRTQAERIDVILRARPDLIVVAGGSEAGATKSILELIETIGIACSLIHENFRPYLLFAGNSSVVGEIRESLDHVLPLRIAPNIRPATNVERLNGAAPVLSEILGEIRKSQIPGLDELERWSGSAILPTSYALGRMIRFLSEVHKTKKGVIGIDMRSNATTVVFARQGDFSIEVRPELGLRASIEKIEKAVDITKLRRWISEDVHSDDIQKYLWNKSLYPLSIPITTEELEIEYALVRELLYESSRLLMKDHPDISRNSKDGILPSVEPIIVSGDVFKMAPTPAHTALLLLDGLQPVGITTFVVDQNNLMPALGLAAAENPLLAIQVLDSNAFQNLGTVIVPIGKAKKGTIILRVQVRDQNGNETAIDVKQGSLQLIPLLPGHVASLRLQPLHMFDVGMGAPGRGGNLKVVGGALGVIIDARGRPLKLPKDAEERSKRIKKWLTVLGG